MPKVTATSSSSSSKKAKVVPTSNCKKEIDKIDNSDDVSCSTHFRDPCCKQSVHFSDENMPPLLPKAFADKLLLQLKQHAGEGLIEDCLSLEVLKEGLEAEPETCYNCIHLDITQRPLTFDEVGPYPTAYDPEMPWYMIGVTDWSVPRKGFGYVNGCANCMTLKTVVKQFDGCIITCHENPSIPASTFGQCSFVRRDLKPPVKYNRFDVGDKVACKDSHLRGYVTHVLSNYYYHVRWTKYSDGARPNDIDTPGTKREDELDVWDGNVPYDHDGDPRYDSMVQTELQGEIWQWEHRIQ